MPALDFSKATEIKVIGNWTGEVVVKKFNYIPSSKGSGKPAYRIDLTCDNGDEFDGTPLFIGGSFQDQSLWGAKTTLVGLGMDPDLLAGKIDTSVIEREITGNRAIATVEPETYMDERNRNEDGSPKEKVRNRVVNVTPA